MVTAVTLDTLFDYSDQHPLVIMNYKLGILVELKTCVARVLFKLKVTRYTAISALYLDSRGVIDKVKLTIASVPPTQVLRTS